MGYNTGMKQYESPMDAALSYLAPRMRTKKETEKRLLSLGYDRETVEGVLTRLGELGLVNDGQYAAEFIRSRTASGSFSRTVLKYQLMRHETDQEAAETALDTISAEDEYLSALSAGEKEWRVKSALPVRERRQKVLAKLCRKGYDTETALKVCRELGACEPEEEPGTDGQEEEP